VCRRCGGANNHLANNDPTERGEASDPTLTPEELRTIEELVSGGGPLRLEQERIPWVAAEAALGQSWDIAVS
jgi:hypothetical protein